MRSEEPATLAADYAALAAELGLPEAQRAEQKLAVEAVRKWLGQHGDWLLIFDNARTREGTYSESFWAKLIPVH